ncbi:MAG: PEP-CTERM sorting domain-containing protein, partial [Denitromonas halophila]
HTTDLIANDGGRLRGPGNLTVASSHVFNNATQAGTGRTILQGTGTISSTLNLDDDRVIENQDTTVWSGGNIEFNRLDGTGGAGTIQNNADAVFIATGNNTMRNYLTGTAGLFDNQGVFRKSGGTGTTTVSNTLNNSGTVEVQTGRVEVRSAFTNNGEILIASGAAFSGTDSTFINDGTIAGSGRLETHANGDIENNGTIAPGASGIGILTVDADLRLQSASLLEFELASLGSFDQMLLTGDILVGGGLSIQSLAGYVPQIGDSFVIATFNSSIGNQAFSSVNWSGFGTGIGFNVTYNADNIMIGAVAAVPEPSEYLMMMAGLGLLGVMVRRRR